MTKTPVTAGLLVIFGITGDLARRYLLPALYHLSKDGLLPEHFEIIGITRRDVTAADLLSTLSQDLAAGTDQVDEPALKRLGTMIRMVNMNMTDLADYRVLKKSLDDIENEHGVCLNRLFYLSIPPQIFGPVVDFLGESGLNTGCQHGEADSRIMVEKPFGYDLASAQELIARLRKSFSENQIYRIDHYLAKETAQNILVFRYANPVFQAVWNNQSVARIDILASESIGIEGRGAFYEATGALRDFIQNHLLQLLAISTMEMPQVLDSDRIHASKLHLMRSIAAIRPSDVPRVATRAQYQGYRDEVGNPDSWTETFARVELAITDERWQGVPVTLTTGKHLDKRRTVVAFTFATKDAGHRHNTLEFRIQPDEGISIDLIAKKPGFGEDTEPVAMTFHYRQHGDSLHPNAYERVLMDGIRGDQTLFASSEEVLESWRIVDSVVSEWSKTGQSLIPYLAGSSPESIASAKTQM